MSNSIRNKLVLTGFLALKFVLQYSLIAPEYELHRDEFLHLDLGKHLAWGYQSVPPFISWTSSLIDMLGNSVFWVKFFPALFGALTILVVWKTIRALGGNLFALSLGAAAVLFSALLRMNTLYQPNSFDVLCWASFYFVIIKYFQDKRPKWLFAAAAVFALGFLNKYNIVFLLLGLFPAILLTPHRKMFMRKEFYWALLLGTVLILSNLLWQYTNDFPVVHHLKELSENQLNNVNRWDFLRSQLLFFAGGVFVIIAGLYALIAWKAFDKYRAFLWAFVFTLVIFLIFKAKDYYAMGLYPVYITFGAVYLEQLLVSGQKRYMRPAALLFPVLLFLPLYDVAFPNRHPQEIAAHPEKYEKLGLLRWEDGQDHRLPQDFADMLGWKELAKKVDSVYNGLSNPEQTLVITDNYGQAGAINFYTEQDLKAVSFNADYVNWFDLERPYLNLIRVKIYTEEEEELNTVGPFFDSAELADSIENPFSREYRTRIFVFSGARVDLNEKVKEFLQKEPAYRGKD
ncbi:Dolichyl-phosphate-mannose-protein mannosyltransferase [Salinimicrobium catena]|uniref:Dolichyl-phosphate-mannose-protein mannosyltransferase n=1 Tax=Salinimicrobium catena TaxID=390640 RepID=A0A1H5P954_9FLAO|nr:glycosyltransferase family 39 protein [Salinimicrobium catena]SDL70375.1 Dolichyl-phosphate-mannose-protein mannosyltransferase [Salinimicrobium catena]SEF09527.1 Dolichyl-phosphate-mannose-protein mannosyltransferase [Salinimicrobium catena]